MFDEYGVQNCKIELIENYPCTSKEELFKREGFYILNNECVNKKIAGRSQKEYKKQYNIDNKEYFKQYREDHKDKIAEQKKHYCEKHKDEIIERKKQFYEMNKETINEKRKEKITCLLCGCISRRSDIAKHQRSIKCQTLSKSLP